MHRAHKRTVGALWPVHLLRGIVTFSRPYHSLFTWRLQCLPLPSRSTEEALSRPRYSSRVCATDNEAWAPQLTRPPDSVVVNNRWEERTRVFFLTKRIEYHETANKRCPGGE